MVFDADVAEVKIGKINAVEVELISVEEDVVALTKRIGDD